MESEANEELSGEAVTVAPTVRVMSDSEQAVVEDVPVAVLLRLLGRRLLAAALAQMVRISRELSQIKSRWQSRTVWPPTESQRSGLVSSWASVRGHCSAWLDQVRGSPDPASWKLNRFSAPAILIAFAVMVYVAYCIATIPFAGASSALPAPSAMVVETGDGHAFATRGVFKGERILADQVPTILASAVTSIEDRRFYQEGGIDLRAMIRAALHDLMGRKLEGGSTITQQLARRLYLSPERTLKRKVQEAFLAFWLNIRFSKKEILARYLDSAYFGDGAYGVDAAAKRYFGKRAQNLTLSEAAMLAGLIRSPSVLDPSRNFDRATERANIVLGAMVENGAISQQQADAARQRPAALRLPPQPTPDDNYFIDTAASEVRSLIGPTTEDLAIRTTLDRTMQAIAENVIGKRLAAAGKSGNVHQAALVAMAPDGAILAMVGGRNYNESQFNRVTQARRQPGSLFKLFVYLAAMRRGLTPDSVLVDQPVSIGNWQPENYNDRYRGPVTLRTAFAQSLNSIAVQLAEIVGIPTVIDTAKQLGIQSDLPSVPSVALGSADVTLLEMTNAFAAVAANTDKISGYAVNEIRKGGQSIYKKPVQPTATPGDPRIHAEMIDLLTSVVREGTGKAARLDQVVGGKTGTSQDYRDAWFIGFTSGLVVGVWVGNDDNTPMNTVTGGSLPATIWHDFVSSAESARRTEDTPVAASEPFGTVGSAAIVGTETTPNSGGTLLRGRAKILDGATLELNGQIVRLSGVDGAANNSADLLRRALRHREVSCTPVAGGSYDCRVGGVDVSEFIPSIGHASPTADLGIDLGTTEEQHLERHPRSYRHRNFWLFFR